ncbi:MAG TPA: ATP synthase F0 subunit B [Polyangiaceae bacterium]|jgi:F-type H+-transporting ATPase subunit b|nr:ATP synthase F0 subunit B [Polyangiaceae bacterium]
MSVLPPGSAVPVLALSGGVTLDFDNTLVFQVFIFIVLMFLLEPLLFAPVLRVFALREDRTEGAKAQARELDERAGDLYVRYQKELERVNRVAAEERDKVRAETIKLEAEILAEARSAAGRIVEDGRKQIAAELGRVQFEVGRESERIAAELSEHVLGRKVS